LGTKSRPGEAVKDSTVWPRAPPEQLHKSGQKAWIGSNRALSDLVLNWGLEKTRDLPTRRSALCSEGDFPVADISGLNNAIMDGPTVALPCLAVKLAAARVFQPSPPQWFPSVFFSWLAASYP